MSLFQPSVLKNYLSRIDSNALQTAWEKFQLYFGDLSIQQNIRDSKEEQYQEGFLRELFGNIFGYTLNPEKSFNLLTELKNVKNSKKADGAIVQNGQVIAVIELKSTKVSDLSAIEQQAFGYKSNQRGCTYVITSNFEKLRFYIDDAVEFEEFNLFTLDVNKFALLYLCLSVDTLLTGLPANIKAASTVQEETVTKKLYRDYSTFKQLLYTDILKQNSQYDPLLLFRKTQKLLDRFLFILFAEDRELLPPNSISEILSQWTVLKELDENVPLYSRFIKYFGYLNTGRKGKRYDIFAYNGGLFAPDEVIESLLIDDQLLFEQTSKLTRYDFETDVDVNILGHIFEHSLNELEEVTADREGRTVAYQDTKRKRDGVFYTPKHITQYIVRNTLGVYCNEKKQECKIAPDDFTPDLRKVKKRELLSRLDGYRNWLLNVTILDPACGSGAFLNEALDYLINEHRQLDEMNASLLGIPLILTDVENSILENNIYGVDLNDESIEIAKLSLWLRTARKGRKLSSLNNNIIVGNSLISDPLIAGDKSFHWQNTFSDVFKAGGFDIVIGNPPYVPARSLDDDDKLYYYAQYNTAQYQINLYSLFIELGFSLLRKNGLISLIVPNYFLSTQFDENLRKYMFHEYHTKLLLNTYNVFETANVDTVIFIGESSLPQNRPTRLLSISDKLKNVQERLVSISDRIWYFEDLYLPTANEDIHISFQKNLEISTDNTLSDYLNFSKGMQPYEEGKGTPPQTREMMNKKVYHSHEQVDSTFHPLLTASSVKKYQIKWEGQWIKYGDNLAAPRKPSIFTGERILLNRIMVRGLLNATYIATDFINNSDIFNLTPKIGTDGLMLKVINAILCSNFCGYYLRSKNVNLSRKAFPKINVNTLESFPIPEIPTNTGILLCSLVDQIITETQKRNEQQANYYKFLFNNFSLKTISKKIADLAKLSFKDFLFELGKQNVTLTLIQQADWMSFIDNEQIKARMIERNVEQLDLQINNHVYQLFKLNNIDIVAIEGN